MDEFFQFLGSLVAYGAVVGGVALGLFKVFGERMINHRFDRALESFKDEHAREMEHLRYQISGLLDRTTKLNDKEFEVIPEAWSRLVDAYYTTVAHCSSAKQIPGVNKMNAAQLEEFLQGSQLTETQKADLRVSSDKLRDYSKMIYWHEKAHAENSARALSNYIEKFGLFIRTKAKFEAIADMIWAALLENQLSREDLIHPEQGKSDRHKLEKEGKAALQALEAELHNGLWTTDLTPKPTLPKRT